VGVKYSSSESSLLIEAMNSNIEIANEITDRLSSGSDHLISALESGELQGAAYTAGKNLFSDIIIPSIKKLQTAVDDIQTELTSYKNADAVISGFGELDLDDLKTQKETRENQLAEVKSQIRENEKLISLIGALGTGNLGNHFSKNNALHELEYQLQMGIDELKDKIEKLEWFVSQVSQYFSDSLQVLSLAIQGATQLSKIIVDSNGNYYVDGVDMTWFDKMKNTTLKNHDLKPIDKNLSLSEGRFINTLQDAYGFNKTESKILLKLYQNLEQKYGTEKANIEFYKIIGSYTYGDQTYGAWQVVAGLYSPNGINGIIVGINAKMKHVLGKYGLKDFEIDTIQKAIQNQHNFTNLKKIRETDSEEEVRRKLDAGARNAYGENVKYADLDDSQKSRVRELLSQFGETIDYSHMATTISAHYTGNHGIENEDDLAGWQGDVAGALGISPSLGNDDYQSDLDAVNIYNQMKDGDTVINVTNSYYENVEKMDGHRSYEFVKNIGGGDYVNGMKKLEETYKLYVASHSREQSATFEKFMNAIKSFKKDIDSSNSNSSIGE
jgi:hypothetical protein